MEEIKDLLDGEIKDGIQTLSELELGSKEMSIAIDDLSKLYRLRIEETKNENDFSERYYSRKNEEQLKTEQLKEQIKDRYFRIGLDMTGIILPLIFYAVWMKKGFKFEETGTFTSNTFRGLFNRFKPTKK